ncbi:MAG: DUF3108 domain-containing protein [Vicinamibacterales bacterium]
MDEQRGRRVSEALGATLFYAAAAVLMTWPVVLAPLSRLAAPVAEGDPLLNLWILGWDLRVLSTDPLAVVSGRIFDANIFHPAASTLAYSDHLIPQALLLLPLYVLAGDLVACYNALFVLSLVASAVSMYAFARMVTASPAAALVAGTAWGFAPYHFAHLVHLQLQSLWVLPLTFLFLHRVAARRRALDAVVLGMLVALQAVSSAYYGVIGGAGLAVASFVLARTTGQVRSRRFWSCIAAAVIVSAVAAAPFVWPYWRVQQQEGLVRNLYEAGHHSARMSSYLRVPPENLLYGRTGILRPDRSGAPASDGGPERELFCGFTLATLALLGAAWSRRRSTWPLAATYLAVAAVGFVLSLGPEGSATIYATLHRFVFGFQAIRAPARFGVLVTFGAALLAALGVAKLVGRLPDSRPWRLLPRTALLVGAVLVEYVNVPLPTVPAPVLRTPVGAWLAAAPEPGAVVYLPLGLDAENTRPMVESLQHGRPIVNGYSGQRPPFFVPLVETMSAFPSPESLLMLHDLGVRFVVSDAALDVGAVTAGVVAAGNPLVERARFGSTVIHEVRWNEDLEREIARASAPAPPEPGLVPFEAGERATYEVFWKGAGGLTLAAGQAVFVVDGPGTASAGRLGVPDDATVAGAAYRFTLDARTAPLVSRFFEAQDRFETWADSRVLPLLQHQHIHEGRRVLDRVTRFDAERGTVETGTGPRLPLAAGSRDPLAAFHYLRTIRLASGDTVRIPLSEGGRNLVVVVVVRSLESIEHRGVRVQAMRLTLVVEERLQRRRPIEATAWLSTDGRRIPLIIEVSAGFGDFRAELAEHRANMD